MLTIIHLTRALNLSRSSLFYYERFGLLCPALRGANGYRHYGETELERGRQVADFRAMGLPLEEIASLLNAAPPVWTHIYCGWSSRSSSSDASSGQSFSIANTLQLRKIPW